MTPSILSHAYHQRRRDVKGLVRLPAFGRSGRNPVITRADEPIAEVKKVAPIAHEPRPFGLCADEFRVPDDFDAPLPDSILDAFELDL